MTIIKRYPFDTTKITHTAVDTNYVWLAFQKDSDGICHLMKVAHNDFTQVYLDIEIENIDVILDIKISSSFIYVLFDGSTENLVGKRYSTSNPFSSYSSYTKPYGIPTPLELAVGDYVYVLLPDASGGVGAKILKYSLSGTFSETVNINDYLESSESVTDVTSITCDDDDNLWLVTYTNPVKLVRLWFASGGWAMQIKSIE